MFEISMELEAQCDSGNIITVKETGEALEEMNLKKDISGEILKTLKEHKATGGKYNINLLIEKDGAYYDHDVITINIDDTLTDLIFFRI